VAAVNELWSLMQQAPMRTSHRLQLFLGVCHLLVCGVLGSLDMLISFGESLSDTYNAPDGWFVNLDETLLILQAPVAAILRLVYHPTARFAPPGLFVIDYAMSSNVLVSLPLCALWSIAFGYLGATGIRRFRADRAASAHDIDQQHTDEQYQGPRCVACRAPIERSASICTKCGWTQPK
jgi:hypothetical protein